MLTHNREDVQSHGALLNGGQRPTPFAIRQNRQVRVTANAGCAG